MAVLSMSTKHRAKLKWPMSALLKKLPSFEAIYDTELTVDKDEKGKPRVISVLLHPATGMDESKRYVRTTLK